jgi:hypothetical protein
MKCKTRLKSFSRDKRSSLLNDKMKKSLARLALGPSPYHHHHYHHEKEEAMENKEKNLKDPKNF